MKRTQIVLLMAVFGVACAVVRPPERQQAATTTSDLVLTLAEWNRYLRDHPEAWLEDVVEAGAHHRFLAEDLVHNLGQWYFILQNYGSDVAKAGYTYDVELGWLVRYMRPGESTEKGPSVAVFLPNMETPYLDLLLRGRYGWTHQFSRPLAITTSNEATTCATKYLSNLNVDLSGLEPQTIRVMRASYTPKFSYSQELRKAWEQMGKPEPRRLPENLGESAILYIGQGIVVRREWSCPSASQQRSR
jgi:hypothetical protein